VALVAAAAWGCGGDDSTCEPQFEGPGQDCQMPTGRVLRVLDGDTIEVLVECGGGDECSPAVSCGPDRTCGEGQCLPNPTVRFLAINTGETEHTGAQEPLECMAGEARARIQELAMSQDVRFVYDPIQGCDDFYGRRLAYIWVGDTLLQERLLQEGLACLYWYDAAKQKTETVYYERLAAAEARARQLGLGIWSPNGSACNGLPLPERCR